MKKEVEEGRGVRSDRWVRRLQVRRGGGDFGAKRGETKENHGKIKSM